MLGLITAPVDLVNILPPVADLASAAATPVLYVTSIFTNLLQRYTCSRIYYSIYSTTSFLNIFKESVSKSKFCWIHFIFSPTNIVTIKSHYQAQVRKHYLILFSSIRGPLYLFRESRLFPICKTLCLLVLVYILKTDICITYLDHDYALSAIG